MFIMIVMEKNDVILLIQIINVMNTISFLLLFPLLSLVPISSAYNIPASNLFCGNIACNAYSNITSCVETCCCSWCNSVAPTVNGSCVPFAFECSSDMVTTDCPRDHISPTFVTIFVCVVGITFLVWIVWVIVQMTSNIRQCCRVEYTPIPHL